ncbi:CsbD family protein [Alkalibacterium thalassium]|uniref:CsbD-like n=1 Tax=Alkalibacterium thalassium TaxID=426701 RepID=A0A1G8ZFW2_9LACT|nr:CsbD family protein [Alkalibacterium thalassium]SDK13843.1 CsbD-like [Alkalibacterium thalassium]
MDENKDSLKHKAKGAKDKIVGGIKDSFGDATDDKGKQAEGKAQKAKGHVHDAVGDAKEDHNRD